MGKSAEAAARGRPSLPALLRNANADADEALHELHGWHNLTMRRKTANDLWNRAAYIPAGPIH
jgi:hypothetical protein